MLTPVIQKDFHKLAGILQRNIESCKITGRTSVEYITASLTLHAAQDCLGVWTDDLDDPHAILVATVGKFGVLNETYCFVNTIYVDNGHRSSSVTKQMLDTLSLYATSKGCDTVQGSSWIYDGATDTASFWESFGAAAQETIYIKHL